MRRRYYFDTSVFGGVFDDDEFKEESIQLFEQVKRGRVICLYSEIVEKELLNAPEKVKLFAESLPQKSVEKLAISPAMKALAAKYITEKIVGAASHEDCLHIATATAYNADALVSWNFKHIVNTVRIEAYNSVNLQLGYRIIEICSPQQILSYEKEKKEKGF